MAQVLHVLKWLVFWVPLGLVGLSALGLVAIAVGGYIVDYIESRQ